VYVSFAGNEYSHNNLRIFANGKGTYEVIRKNLLYIKERDASAYMERIHFIFNIFDERQLFEIRQLLKTENIFKDSKYLPEVTGIDTLEDNGSVSELKLTFLEKYSVHNSNTLSEYINLLQQKKYNDIFVKYYDEKFIPIHRRAIDDDSNFITGVCRPFAKKLFVDVDGNIHVCENFLYGTEFGSVYEPLNDKRLQILLERFRAAKEEKCANCWASKLCGLCYKDFFDKYGNLNDKRIERICNHEKLALENILQEYCSTLELDSTLLDHLNEYVLYS